LEAIVTEGLEMIDRAMRDMKETSDPKSILKGMIIDLFNIMVDDDPHFWKLYFNLLMLPDLPEGIRKIFNAYITSIFRELENVFRDLGVNDPVAEARIFAALGDGVILHYWMVGKQYPLQEVRDLILKKYVK
jgi:hypothetical protein